MQRTFSLINQQYMMLVFSKGLQNSYYSDTSSHGMVEASNIERPSTEAFQSEYGVSAIELDHRLREVLEAQQQDRILELEQLLKETEAKLLVKEREILGWKNHVNSLTNLFQHASESVTSYDSFVAAAPVVTKNTLELLHSFRDPPISTQVNYGESASSLDLLAKISMQESDLRSSSGHVFSNEGNSFSIASSLGGSLVTESNFCWDRRRQGTGIDTPDFVIMEELDAHIAAQKSEILRDQAVSKALEISDCIYPNEWSNEIQLSSHGFDGRSGSLLIGVDEEDTALSLNETVPSSLRHMICKLDTNGIFLSPSDFGRELEKDSSDVKHIVSSFKLKLASDDWSSGLEGMQVPKKGSKIKNESLQIGKGSRMSTFQEGSVEVKSPVLDKIRHYEALVGRARGKWS